TAGTADLFLLPEPVNSVTTAPKRLTWDERAIMGVAWTPDGRDVVYASGQIEQTLWRLPVEAPERKPPPPPGLEQEGATEPAISRPTHGQPARLAYRRTLFDRNIWRMGTKSTVLSPTSYSWRTSADGADAGLAILRAR